MGVGPYLVHSKNNHRVCPDHDDSTSLHSLLEFERFPIEIELRQSPNTFLFKLRVSIAAFYRMDCGVCSAQISVAMFC